MVGSHHAGRRTAISGSPNYFTEAHFQYHFLLTLKVIIDSGRGFDVALAHGSELKFCNKSSMNGGSQ